MLTSSLPWKRLYRSPDGEGSGGGEGGEGAPDKNGEGAGDAGNGNGGGNGDGTLIDLDGKGGSPKAGERPAYIPETLWDAEKKAVKEGTQAELLKELDTQHRRAEGLRRELGKAPQKAPAKAEDYKLPDFTKDDKDKPLAEIFKADDPFVKGMSGVFHKYGVSQAQYEGIMKDAGHLLAGMKPDGSGEPAALTEDEIKDIQAQEMAKIGPNAPRIAAAVSEHFSTLIKQGHFNDAEVKEIKAMASTAEGLTVLNKLRALMGGESIPLGNSLKVDGLLDDAEIFAMMSTPAYQNSSDPGHAEMHRKYNAQLALREKAGRPVQLQV